MKFTIRTLAIMLLITWSVLTFAQEQNASPSIEASTASQDSSAVTAKPAPQVVKQASTEKSQVSTQTDRNEEFNVELLNTKYDTKILLGVLFVGSLLPAFLGKQYGWDMFHAPAFVLANFIVVIYALSVLFRSSPEHSVWMERLIAYLLIASGSLGTIWTRNKIMDWYSGSSWVFHGESARQILFKQIGQRFGMEAFAAALGGIFGWCGLFVMGVVELKRRNHVEQ